MKRERGDFYMGRLRLRSLAFNVLEGMSITDRRRDGGEEKEDLGAHDMRY